MASVWRARDEVLARTVAVKVLHPNLAEDADFVERFRREAFAAARLAHPHIVAVYDTGSERAEEGGPESHYIVMEYCGGGTLDELRRGEGTMAPQRAAAVGATICDALHYAHRHEIIHRDIKPQNVLLSDHGVLKVADFGIAKAAFASSDITSTGAILGTVTYLSPEQVNGREPGPASDLYSLGVVIHELVCGQPPFRAESQIATAMAHTRTPPPPLGQIRGGIPRELERIVLKALAKEPEDRFASAQEMAAALRTVGDDASTSVLVATSADAGSPAGAEERAAPARAKLQAFLPLLALVVLTIAAALAIPRLTEPDGAGEDGPGGSRATTPLEIQQADDFDPAPGDGVEHPEEIPAAVDGDPSTSWSTESYSTPLEDQKAGVGVVLDLGSPRTVSAAQVTTPTPGFTFELRAGAERADSLDGYEVFVPATTAQETTSVQLEEPAEGRYWLLWITSLPGGEAGNAMVSEVELIGS